MYDKPATRVAGRESNDSKNSVNLSQDCQGTVSKTV